MGGFMEKEQGKQVVNCNYHIVNDLGTYSEKTVVARDCTYWIDG